MEIEGLNEDRIIMDMKELTADGKIILCMNGIIICGLKNCLQMDSH